MSYYAYTRVSTETQAEKGGGLNVQKEALKKYAADHSMEISGWFEDAGISGTQESRPALDALLIETAKQGDTILVHNTSRLWRNIFAQATVLKLCNDNGVEIKSIDEPAFSVQGFLHDPDNFMISGMFGMLDTWERMTIARKLARGRTTKANKGIKPAGICPYGYTWAEDHKTVIVNADEARIVKRMFTLAQTGKTLSQIADTLTAEGSKASRGGDWTRGSVRAILHNRFYCGELSHQGKTIAGAHEPLVSKIQFGKVQSQLEKRHK